MNVESHVPVEDVSSVPVEDVSSVPVEDVSLFPAQDVLVHADSLFPVCAENLGAGQAETLVPVHAGSLVLVKVEGPVPVHEIGSFTGDPHIVRTGIAVPLEGQLQDPAHSGILISLSTHSSSCEQT